MQAFSEPCSKTKSSMAYIRINPARIEFYSGNGGPTDGFFYKEDIELVMNQEGVISLHIINAIVGEKECKMAVGVTSISKDGIVDLKREEGDIAAIYCPPYNSPGEYETY